MIVYCVDREHQHNVLICMYSCSESTKIKCAIYTAIYEELKVLKVEDKYINKYGEPKLPIPKALRPKKEKKKKKVVENTKKRKRRTKAEMAAARAKETTKVPIKVEVEVATKSKRKRRTKAEMEEARKSEQQPEKKPIEKTRVRKSS